MPLIKVLIIWTESDIENVRQFVEKTCTSKVTNHVDYLSLPHKYIRSQKTEFSEKNQLILDEKTATTEYTKIYLHSEIPISSSIDISPPPSTINSRATLFREITSYLKDNKFHWESYAEEEWKKSSIRGCNPRLWVEQFARLGHSEIGINLLKLIHVIEDNTLRRSFSCSTEDFIGLDIQHAFFYDSEKGSSSITVQSILERMYTQCTHKIEDTNIDSLEGLPADRLYIYEDGLWSGVELVRRIKSIYDSKLYQNTNMHFYFKFAALTDVGLVAARFLTKSLNTSRFHFIPGPSSQYFEFFGKEKTAIYSATTSDHHEQRAYLDTLVEPYAFKFSNIWGTNRELAIEVCQQIGEQLLLPFLEKKYGTEDASRKIMNWKLGAMNFASTIVFSSSVPKPVLPLLWLEGPVKIGEREIYWQPLFNDARRTGKDNTK